MKIWSLVPAAALLAACVGAPPPPPPAPYRAVGADWTLLIDERDITFIQGQAIVRQPKPSVIGGIAGEIYQTPRIGVNIVHIACTDARTGASHPDRVQVDVDGRRFEGCGGH